MRMLNHVHPGRFLRSEIIEAHNLSVTQAAKVLRVSRPTVRAKGGKYLVWNEGVAIWEAEQAWKRVVDDWREGGMAPI